MLILHSVLLGFLTFHVLVFQRAHVLETESVSILRWQGGQVPTTLPSVLILCLHAYLHSFYFKFLYHFSFKKLDVNGLDSYSWLILFDDRHQLFLMGLNKADALSTGDRSIPSSITCSVWDTKWWTRFTNPIYTT
jgi:superoxide dismutase